MIAGEKNSRGLMEQQLKAEEEDQDGGGMLSVQAITTRFKENTTAHGIPHVHKAQGTIKTIFWIIVALSLTGAFGYNAYLLIEEFAAYNVTTSVTIESSASVKLPAITFCNYNSILDSKLKNDPSLQAILSAFTGRRKKRDTEAVSHNRLKRSSGQSRDSQFLFQQKIMDAIADFSLVDKKALGHQIDDLIIQCKYNGYSCNITSDFYQFYDTNFGNCYTYNWGRGGESYIISKRQGTTHGLSIVFNTYQDEYVGFLTEAAGMRVVVHDQDQMPFPVDEGIACSPGELTNIGMKKISIARMGYPYGTCISSSTADFDTNVFAELFGVKYTSKACEVTCYQKNVISKCGCGDPMYPLSGQAFGDAKVTACKTSNTTQDDCKENVLDLWNNELLGCSCSNPCNEDVFDYTTSVGMWPSDNYKMNLFGQLPNTTMLTSLSQSNDTDEYKRNLGKINVYYEEFDYELIQEDVAYELFSLISDIGGILGLYIGFSLMTILEFFELAVDLTVVLCMTQCNKNRGPTPIVRI